MAFLTILSLRRSERAWEVRSVHKCSFSFLLAIELKCCAGRVRLMVTGSAPLAENVLTFVRAAMGCIVVEGYGQTECVAACTVSFKLNVILYLVLNIS